MATELCSLWGGQVGWRSEHGEGYQVTATLDGIDIWYTGAGVQSVERAFSRACRRKWLRRSVPWLSPPLAHLEVMKNDINYSKK